ncbi:MAG: hypothetical protein IPO92_22530 [Saprospiraceae bacterium]|nr:hypothetical protein [Saprospiraceae bacterium]
MLKNIIILIAFLHGLIHILGFVKAFDYANVSALTKEISKTAGILWLLAAILMIIFTLMFLLKKDSWVYVALTAVVLSQALIFYYWQDAKFGSIANLLILIVSIVGLFHINFKSQYRSDVKIGMQQMKNMTDTTLTKIDILHLPEPVQKYLDFTGCIGKPKVHNFRINFSGKIRSREEKAWMELTSEQYNFMPIPTRLFFLDAIKKQLPVSGFHSFKNGEAFMDIRLLSMFKVQYMKGKEMGISETVTFFNDICCMAPAALIDNRIQWLETEGNKVKASFTTNGITVSAWLYFNEKGEMVNFVSEDRYAAGKDGTLTKLKWSTPLRDYKMINGYKLASYAEAIYTYPDGDFTYATFTLKNMQVNPNH